MSSSDDIKDVELFVSWFALEEQLKTLLQQLESLNEELDELKESMDEWGDNL